MTVFTIAGQVFQEGGTVAMIVHQTDRIFACIKILIACFGTIAIFVGALLAASRYVLYRCGRQSVNSDEIRLDLARSIILGLEFYVAADVIETAIAIDFKSLGILGALVLIRTVLNYSMSREIKSLSNS